MPRLLNQLEPDGLPRHFLAHPPLGFRAWLSGDGVPLFATDFDLLTTVDARLQQRIAALPLSGWWRRRFLRPYTAFAGTTVSEYALLPDGLPPVELARRLKDALAGEFAFFIVKDLPSGDSPLLPAADNAFAAGFARALRALDFILVEGQALAWVPVDFASIDEYLVRLSSGRRREMRRKLRKRADVQIAEIRTGDACFEDEAVIDQYYALYLNVYRQSTVHFDLLSRDFFAAVLRDAGSGGVIFTCHRGGGLIGYNICFVYGDCLIDKYMGLQYPAARECNLYFLTWFHNLEYALRHGLRRYVAGWTDPEIKARLGARFTLTRHAVHVRNPLLRAVLRRLVRHFESDSHWHARQNSPQAHEHDGR